MHFLILYSDRAKNELRPKVVALREARVSYIDGRPFHAYWRIRKSLDSASAASNLGGYQSFNFPMKARLSSIFVYHRHT